RRAQQRRLARAVAAGDEQEAAALGLDVDPAQDAPVAEALLQTTARDHDATGANRVTTGRPRPRLDGSRRAHLPRRTCRRSPPSPRPSATPSSRPNARPTPAGPAARAPSRA